MYRQLFRIIKLVVYFSAPIVLLLLPATFFDHGKSICLSQLLFHTACPGCGMTRAIMHLIHGDFGGASEYNKLSFAVLAVLLYLIFDDTRRTVRAIKKERLNFSPKEA
jgi:hypothetical protein